DILQSLIDSKDPENGEGLKDLEIVDECLVLLFGGMDTTANTMTWTLYEILKHPEVYKQVTSEILTHYPNLKEPITVEKTKSELKYLEACILESMRKNPVASGAIVRVVPESGITISGHYLPPGTSVGLDIYAQQNDPSIWKSPEIFDISRWLGEERELNKSKMFNFGIGPTSCIGRELAWSEIFLVLANLLRSFELEMID
ncbi:cytochrome P450, partial [Conidiobolus coronatus NRRL 28638]